MPTRFTSYGQKGQAMVEYLIVTSAVGLVMFIPTSFTNNLAPADYLARAIQNFFRGFSFLMSVI